MSADPRELIRELAEALRKRRWSAHRLSVECYCAHHPPCTHDEYCEEANAALRRAEAWLAAPASEPVGLLNIAAPCRYCGAIGPHRDDCRRWAAPAGEPVGEMFSVGQPWCRDKQLDHDLAHMLDRDAATLDYWHMLAAYAAGALAERDAEVARLREASAESQREWQRQQDEIDRIRHERDAYDVKANQLAAELAEARRQRDDYHCAVQNVSDALGMVPGDWMLDKVRQLRQERNEALAALAQAQRERDGARVDLMQAQAEQELIRETEREMALRWAAEQVRASARAVSGHVSPQRGLQMRRETLDLADRIARGPQPAERGGGLNDGARTMPPRCTVGRRRGGRRAALCRLCVA